MEKQSTRLNCIIYPGEHYGTILSTYEARIKQLAIRPRTEFDQPSAPRGLITVYINYYLFTNIHCTYMLRPIVLDDSLHKLISIVILACMIATP